MKRLLGQPLPLLFVGGINAGLLLGLVLLAGILLGRQPASPPSPTDADMLPLLQATASHSSDTMAVATGMVSDEMEGVFFLDFLTGELQCYVLSPRTGKWGALFKTNVVKDLGVERGKKPNYLMVTGGANFRGGGASTNLGNCVVYVTDANSGAFVAYAVPFARQAETARVPQAAPLILLDGGKARSLEIRE